MHIKLLMTFSFQLAVTNVCFYRPPCRGAVCAARGHAGAAAEAGR